MLNMFLFVKHNNSMLLNELKRNDKIQLIKKSFTK